MEIWTAELSHAFLPVEWVCSSVSRDNLLIKLLYRREPRRLSILATDLQGVYYESLEGRQLNRRIDDAIASAFSESQLESIGVMAGVGDEGEELVKGTLEDLNDAVRSGRARPEFKEEGFEQFIDIALPSGTTFRFVLFKLERESAQVLASHLIQPLLGTSSALLSLLRESASGEQALTKKLEPAIDSSGRAERLSQGKNCSTFFKVGGAGLLKRWQQSMISANSRRLDPLQLSLPSPRFQNPSTSVSFTSTTSSDIPFASSQPSPPRGGSLSPAKRTGVASKMLDHRSKSNGEKIGWDESQLERPIKTQLATWRDSDRDAKILAVDAKTDREEEDEPSTDEETPNALHPELQPTMHESRLHAPSRIFPPSTTSMSSNSPIRGSSFPLPAFSDSERPKPSSRSRHPSPSQKDVQEKNSTKKRKAEEEEAEAIEKRRAKFALLNTGPSGTSTRKKRGAGTRGL